MSENSLSTPLAEASSAAATGVGLGYGIAIAVGILVLISTIMLASYLCVRIKGGSRSAPEPTTHTPSSSPNAAAVIPLGLDGSTIESYPKFVYGCQVARGRRAAVGPCAICLAEYEEGEVVRCVPECDHFFHARCVDEWLRMSATCPVCRSSPVPSSAATPVATPLSELIPLAVHAR